MKTRSRDIIDFRYIGTFSINTVKKLLLLIFIVLLSSCTKEFVVDVKSNPPEGGDVFPSQGTYKEGSSVTLNAIPNGEYLFDGWSGDALGSSSLIEVIVDDNKNITANFVLKKYELNLQTVGKGDIIETIVNTGKRTDYDSGTVVRLEAVPSTGYYFSGWSFDVISEENPIEINIDRTKTIKATFKKLSYELSILIQGEGTVKEEIIDISDINEGESNKFTDYQYGTIVRLTPTAEEGSDFIEWEDSGVIDESNPLDIIVSEPKTVKAIFEYDLFNLGVGKWKIKKPKTLQEKSAYNVYSIIFNRNRTFRLNYSSGQISDTYSVTSNSNITLNNHGFLSNVQINKNQISFNLNISGLFQFNVTGSRVQTHQQNRTYIPDQNFEQALIEAGYDSAIDNYIDDSSMFGIAQLDLSNRQITDFTGLEEFVNLTDLNLSGNTITSVPVVNLNQLTTLNLSNTGLKELDLSQNSNLSLLNLSGNAGLSCVKVSQQIYQQIPTGWIYDSTTSFELECDCPTLSLTSGEPLQELCDGEAMQSLVYEFGGTGTTINVGTMPSGILSNINGKTLTISGTPNFTSSILSFSVFTSDGNAGCSQASQTVTLTKNPNSAKLTIASGSLNQSISTGAIGLIELSYSGAATDLSITGLPTSLSITKSGQTYTIQGNINTAGTYNGIITTVSSGGCTEITRGIQIVVTAPVVTSIGNTTGGSAGESSSTSAGGNSNGGLSQSGTSTASFSLDVSASSSSDYTLSGTDRNGNISGSDPSLTFNVGDTINFVVNATGHPFYLKTTAGTGTGNTISGVTNNGTTNQTVTWISSSPGTYYYQCSLHGGMVGTITIQ